MAKNQETVVKPEEQVTDPWRVKKMISMPRHKKGEQDFQFVSVNGRTFQVPLRGGEVEVPLPVYEALMNAREAEDYAAERKEAIETAL